MNQNCRGIPIMQRSISRPKLIVVCGLTGSGKTTYAKRLEETLGAVRFCPDEWMQALSLSLHDEDKRAQIEALQWAQAQRLLALGQTVIIEWGTWGRSERDTLRLGARALGAATDQHYLSAPVEVLWKRIQRWGMEDPPLMREDLVRSAEIFQSPTIEEAGLFDAYKAIPLAEDRELPPAPHLNQYRQAIKRIFEEYAAIPYSHEGLTCETVFDRAKDRYLLITFGRDLGKRIHYAVAHVDIVNGKLWIRRDGTEEGIANELVALGVPKEDIVLGFKSEQMRRDTEFAVA